MMGTLGARPFRRFLMSTTTASLLVVGAAPALAQDGTDARLKKVEAEVRALQRKVFPGADGKYFEPEITAPTAAGTTATPTTTPVTDLLTRMDAIEAQMARLTAQVEQNTNRINQLEARLPSGMQPAAAVSSTTPAPTPASTPTPAPSTQTNLSAMTGGASTQAPTSTPAAAPASRVEAVKAIIKPQTDDPADDEYSYGYRLWDAGYFPEARQQLKIFLEKYPKHRRASWARNLLGRAWLDDNNPGEAAKWFLQNYQTEKRGERAPDSLLYLAISMKQMKDTKRACIALAEFSETYAAEAAGRLSTLYASTRNGLACS